MVRDTTLLKGAITLSGVESIIEETKTRSCVSSRITNLLCKVSLSLFVRVRNLRVKDIMVRVQTLLHSSVFYQNNITQNVHELKKVLVLHTYLNLV